jgi:methyl-accepting chemotaxis protein
VHRAVRAAEHTDRVAARVALGELAQRVHRAIDADVVLILELRQRCLRRAHVLQQRASASGGAGDLRALEQKVDVEVRDQISTLDESVNRKLTDLKDMVEDKVQKSIDTMSTQLEVMNTRVKKEMEPKLAETERVALSVQGKLETLETRVMLEQDELKTGMTKSLEGISTELDDLTSKVDEMTADLDINALLMGAATIKP